MFAIYLPGRGGIGDGVVSAAGASWALDPAVTPMFADVPEGGPDGGGGRLVYFDQGGRFSPQHLAVIDLEAQLWQPSAPRNGYEGGRYWIGVWKKQKPTPEDLQRDTVIDGAPLRLQDGQDWIIPVADYCPKLLKLNPQTGEEEKKPIEAYRSFTEATNKMFKHLISDEFQGDVEQAMKVVIPGGLVYAAEALAINYRVNPDIVSMLDLIGEFEALQIASVATGLDLIAHDQKKRPLRAMTNSDS